MTDRFQDSSKQIEFDNYEPTPEEHAEMYDVFVSGDGTDGHISKGESLNSIVDICLQPPQVTDMEKIQTKNCIFMISPFKYDLTNVTREPTPSQNGYVDRWDNNHVRMPCSPSYVARDGRSLWLTIKQSLSYLKQKCDQKKATFEDLQVYSDDERASFMSTILSNICFLALNVDTICSRPPPLLRTGTNHSVTMSQKQAASLLACAFFCLFPYRSDHDHIKEYENFQNPNFNRLYQSGPSEQTEKLKCILHYFRRITTKMPNGVITFRRYALSTHSWPKWSDSKNELCPMHLTTNKKIEDISCVLQVDFANKYIGGGVLGSGCVQEEIRFSICPEMLVSLLVCEVMELHECIFLIGCERYSSYKGYANTFQFGEDYVDYAVKDSWGRKWCHLVAMDAIFFRDRTVQYSMKSIDRELIKAFTSFRPLETGSDYEFGIATGNWGCGVFNGDKQLKAIIQLMAASQARRPLIYAAYFDKSFVNLFFKIYEYLLNQKATIRDLYEYLSRYSHRSNQSSLFDYILATSVSSLRS